MTNRKQKSQMLIDKHRQLILLILHLCTWTAGFGQITFRPISASTEAGKNALRTMNAERDSTQMLLPFWDDFSQTDDLPDSMQWFVDAGSVNISPSVGINPPTINVAVFDGWNTLGTPYSATQLEEGAGDSLVSRFIDLTKVNPALRETVYISFFWQKEGRGEMPDDQDSIRLQAMDSSRTWVTLWSKNGMEAPSSDQFTQEIIQVKKASFFHEYFQFRFQSFGRLSGGFDTWNIDYVYMNYNRSPSDLAYEDRALNTRPNNWLTQYTAMPYDHFLTNLEQNPQPVTVGVSNLDDQVQPIEYYAQIRDSIKIFDEMNQGTPLNLAPGTISTITSEPIDPNAFDQQADSISLVLTTKFFINSGDSANLFDKYDLRVNDTTYSKVLLEDELAYDDGTAEWAAGLSQKSAMLAYRFVVPKSDAITSVKFYFPDFAPSPAGKTFTLIIWDDLFKYREGRQLTEQHIVQKSSRLNEYVEYTLGRPVVVNDTFYVGYEQSVDDFFALGLDKYGPPHPGNIFINLDGVWEPSNQIDGNLMIRPVFGFKKAVGLQEEIFKGIRIFPNPNHGIFTISGGFDVIHITDLLGHRVLTKVGGFEVEEIKIPPGKHGLFLLNIQKEGKAKSYKLVVE